jgi:hypothetical protein
MLVVALARLSRHLFSPETCVSQQKTVCPLALTPRSSNGSAGTFHVENNTAIEFFACSPAEKTQHQKPPEPPSRLTTLEKTAQRIISSKRVIANIHRDTALSNAFGTLAVRRQMF